MTDATNSEPNVPWKQGAVEDMNDLTSFFLLSLPAVCICLVTFPSAGALLAQQKQAKFRQHPQNKHRHLHCSRQRKRAHPANGDYTPQVCCPREQSALVWVCCLLPVSKAILLTAFTEHQFG